MKARRIYFGAVVLTVGTVLSACEDADQIEITGPALEEVVSAAQSSADADGRIRIGGVSSRYLGGRAEPWVFINGVRVKPGDWELTGAEDVGLTGIKPDDIEKITVIKGRKAVEQYGPDAWAGVILITTKDSIQIREGSG